MGDVTFSISKLSDKGKNLRGRYVDGGAHTTSTSASNLTDGAAGAGSAISANRGDVLTFRNSSNCRVMFGGEQATATYGHVCYADETNDIEVSGKGEISVIDLA